MAWAQTRHDPRSLAPRCLVWRGGGQCRRGDTICAIADTTTRVAQSLVRFGITALMGFVANELSFIAMTRWLEWPSLIALWLAMVIAAAQTFLLGRFWAFAR